MHHKRRSRRNDKTPMLSCGCCVDTRAKQVGPIEDGPCTGKAKKKKPTPKKDKCPVNRTHEWYKEWVEVPLYNYYDFCDRIFGRKRRVFQATCIHCWKTKELKSERKPPAWRTSKVKVLPKREVRF